MLKSMPDWVVILTVCARNFNVESISVLAMNKLIQNFVKKTTSFALKRGQIKIVG